MLSYKKGKIRKKDSEGRVLKSKTHSFPGEFWDGTKFWDLPCEYSWHYIDNNQPGIKSSLFIVYGTILDEEINTTLQLNKAFVSIESANFYFDTLKLRYPKSDLILEKKTHQNLRHYR